MSLHPFAQSVVTVLEALGVTVIVAGVLLASVRAGWLLWKDHEADVAYRAFRKSMGRALLLGLDLLIAAEIVRSITTETLLSVSVLGITVVVRAFLTFAIRVEVDGRLPWQERE